MHGRGGGVVSAIYLWVCRGRGWLSNVNFVHLFQVLLEATVGKLVYTCA